ncbi:MAG TPA: hypothetical protein VIF02_04110 [Methylocella sp.]|jgi:hypothetical protein
MKNDKEPKSVRLAKNLDGVLRDGPKEGIVRAVIGFERTIRRFVSWASKIDWSAFIDGRWQQHLVMEAAEEALARDDLGEDERHRITGDLEEFKTDFAEIIRSKEACNKEIVLRVVEHALFIGYSVGVPANRLHALRSEVEKARESITKAHTARRADNVQAIIERLAKDLWTRKPSYKTNSEGTAKEIREAVNLEVARLPKIPTRWCPSDSDDKAAIAREIERIRKRIGRIAQPDNSHSST